MSNTTALSQAQLSIWHLHQLSPLSNVFNIGCAFRISQQTDVLQVKNAISKLIEHHEILRTTYDLNKTDVYGIIHDSKIIDFDSTDASQWSQLELEENLNLNLSKPFDIKNGPIIRFRAFTIEQKTASILLICAHNIALDQSSLLILKNELQLLLLDPAAQICKDNKTYSDYIRDQMEYLNQKESEQHLNFWKNELKDVPPLIDIPTDSGKSTFRNFQGKTYQITLNNNLTDRIYEFTKRYNFQPCDILLAAFSIFLSKHASQDTIIIGIPTNERQLNDNYSNLIGIFSNQIPIKVVP